MKRTAMSAGALVSALVRDDEAMRAEATAALEALNVVDVVRMARAHLPAFWSPHDGAGALDQ